MRYPSAPPALALLAGCAIGSVRHFDCGPAAAAILAAWTACLCCWHRGAARGFVASALALCFLCGASLSSSAAHRATHTPLRAALAASREPGPVRDGLSEPVVLSGTLSADASPLERGARLVVDVATVRVDGRAAGAPGRVSLTVTGSPPPSAVGTWRRGRRVEVTAQLRRPARYLDAGVPDQELALARRGTTLVGVVKSALLVRVTGEGSALAEAASEARARVRRCLDETVGGYDARSAGIVRAILLGDRAGLDDQTEIRLQEAGTYHVLAISGGNVAILASVLLGLGRLAGLRPRVSNLAAAGALAAYAGLVGSGASVMRATQMAVIYLCAHAADHRTRPLNAAAASAGASAVLDPLLLFDVGAWLTYGATIAILVGTPRLLPSLASSWRWARAPAGILAASCAAEAALFPVAAMVFHRVTAAGLLLNFAAIPLMTVVQVGGMATVAAACAAPTFAAPLGAVTHAAAWALVESGGLVERAPWLVVRLPAPPLAAVVAYYAAVILVLRLSDEVVRRGAAARAVRAGRRAALACAVAAAVWVLSAPQTRFARTRALEVTFLDVGQGAATLVRFPSGHAMLVDAGGAGGGHFDIGRRVVAPAIWAAGVHALTCLVATHGDADHIGGAGSVVRDFRPPEIWEGVAVPPEALLRELQAAARQAGSAWHAVRRGDAVTFDDVEVSILHPLPPDWERQRVRNDDSIVLDVRMGSVSVVLTGDIEAAAEADLARVLAPAPIRVLQAPHHGSATSSSWALLRAAAPRAAIVSAGRGNRYGHPHQAVLARYAEAGVPVFRTDLEGAIALQTDGRTAMVRTFTGRQVPLRPASAGPDAPPP